MDRYVDSAVYPQARLLLGLLVLEKHQFDQAQKAFENVLKSNAEAEVLARAHGGMAALYEELGKFTKSQEEYETILTKYANTDYSFQALLKYVELLTRMNNYDKAISFINKYLDRFKNTDRKNELKLTLAAVYFIKNDFFLARKTLEEISSVGLNDTLTARRNFYLAMVYAQENKLDKAINLFNEVLSKKQLEITVPNLKAESERKLAYLYLLKNNFQQAYTLLENYLQRYPNAVALDSILIDFFRAALKNGAPQAAEEIYQEFLKRFPRHSARDDLLFLLGKYYFFNGNYSFSKKKFDEFREKYFCSEKLDSTLQFLHVINQYYNVDQNISVNKLAKLIGRLLAGGDLQELKLELAQIYLEQLKDLPEAIQLAESITHTTSDSVLIGNAYFLIGESYRRLAALDNFLGKKDQTNLNKSFSALKKAMEYIQALDRKDSLAYTFLIVSNKLIGNDQLSIEKSIQFWEHFVVTYSSSSLLDKARLILAELYIKKGDISSALRQLNEVKNSNNQINSGIAYFRSAQILHETQDDSRAVEILKKFLLKFQQHPLRAKGFALLAEIHEMQNQFVEAAKLWTEVRENYNYTDVSFNALRKIPEVYLKAREYQQVLDFAIPYLDLQKPNDLLLKYSKKPHNVLFSFYVGKAYYYLNQFAEARKYLLEYLYQEPELDYRDETLYLLGKIGQNEGNDELALIYFQMIKENEQSSFFIQASKEMADIYYKNGQFSKAQNILSSIIAKIDDPDQQKLLRIKEMLCMIHQGQLKLYQNKFSRFKDLYKKDPLIQNIQAQLEFEIGKYYYNNKNFNSAIKNFEHVVKKYKNSRVEKAQEILSKFSQKYPDSPLLSNIFITLGSLYYRGEKKDLALNAFKKATDLAQDAETQKVAISNLIRVYQDLGLWDGVLVQAKAYVERFPNAEDVMNKKILIGSALIHLNRYNEAVDYLKKIKFDASSDEEPEIQFYIGDAYFSAGRYEEAIREFVKIPLLSKQTELQWEASALYYSGQCYEKLGRIDDAIRMYQEIIERPGILVDLKREAKKRIEQLKKNG